VLGRLGRWWIDVVVLLFALYAFVFVPLGKRTAFEHLKAVLATRAARDAGRELVQAGERLKDRVIGEAIDTRGRPEIPDLPESDPIQMRLVPLAAPADASVESPDAGVDASLFDPA
jgi:hypothetical protein